MKLRQREPSGHQTTLLKQLREFWTTGYLCDVVLQSCDGKEHRCHRNILSATSSALKGLLSESFSEGQQIQLGQPVEIAASDVVVDALLDHIYGGEPDISAPNAIELLRLATAYELPKLVTEIESELRASLDSTKALQLLQEIHTLGLPDLRLACEEEIARDFESCVQQATFKSLSAAQLARLLAREDLWVTREEVVLQGLFNWLKASSERSSSLGILLPLIDFRALSAANLERFRLLAQSMGQNGFDLQLAVDEARQPLWQERPAKRRCLQCWSPELGAFPRCFEYGQWVAGSVKLEIPGLLSVCCSPNGKIYVLNKCFDDHGWFESWTVQRLEGSTLVPILVNSERPQQFQPRRIFVSQDETLYMVGTQCVRSSSLFDSDDSSSSDPTHWVFGRITGDAKTVILGRLFGDYFSTVLFATESGKLYIAAFDDEEERTIIWTVNPGDETPMLVLRAGDYVPEDILLMDGYLYLLTSTRQVYRYALPLAPELE
ncbi:unnamed protein product [Durusdinium trenchii]|uniref:BTB domain-containing protein n=1 Tax=Durusdinium trenchii TaxID=1381693 RepID=A0ABP0KYF4_9DINO